MINDDFRILCCLLTWLIGLSATGCTPPSGTRASPGTGYGAVTAEQLRRTPFSHRTGGEDFDFDWSFDGDTFVIEGQQIPADLTNALLGPGVTAPRIEGRWEISNETIVLTPKLDGGKQDAKPCSFPIYFTGVIRIETEAAQYVF